ncbi:unnamed protein product [Bathycoccus prasinos]
MTFINRRIIKRPTLFATSRRNFGNLLTHIETGQDGTTPEPGPDPDPTTPISFTVSWATNGGIIQANLDGIRDGDGTEVITLTRDDGSILATLASGSLGNHTLQHDEGTNYNTYTYTIRLDGVVQSSFTRTYEPNTPSFTTNFFSNTAKVISCGIENITNPHESYSVRLARPDDTILDTQVLNDASSFFLQFTESDYGTYDYKLLLSKWTTTSTSNPNIPPESYWVDTVIATHTQLFPRPEPTFTTSWTKSGLSITADLSSITGAHPEFYAYLTRDDGTVLSTQQFSEGQTTTSLSFTETDYGTFTYQLKLETYIRPEPTFTTSWTKSGLSITADLSSITGAHPEFYAYLTRDDGTTLATHQFAEGQTTTSLTFTEPDYGTFTYQLKLASFSTNELTLTASITSITNAHSSFAITLERDDGTVLQTHTLVDGETSFTFTQTETSYATFNYVVKLNGTQTDTYSATYTPPPTPTFDIALTNDDLAITATLTNIVNPDPYYTFMIHDANDTHLDGHTFATGDTTVTLTWTETSYGEKTYTKLLNGASIGTETITLTDPNASTPPYPSTLDVAGGNWGATTFTLQSTSTTDEIIYWKAGDTAGTTAIYYKVSESKWYDGSSGGQPTAFSINDGTPSDPSAVVSEGDSVKLTAGSSGNYGSFTMFSTSSSSTPTQPTIPNKIDVSPVIHAGHDFYYLSGGSGVGSSYVEGDVLVYAYRAENEQAYYRTIQYQSGVWSDLNSSENPTDVATNNNSQNISITLGNTYSTGFVNPFYEAPTSVPSFNAENGGGWNGGVSTFYRYTGFTGEPTDGYVYTFAYNGVSPGNTSETIKYSFANGWEDYPLNSTTTNPFSVNTSDGSTAIGGTIYPANTIVGLDTAGNFLFKFGHNATYPDPYYEAPAYRTGTSQGFAFTSGTWKGYGYTAIIDDEATSSSGKLVNGVRQWEWDMPDIGGGRLYSGANNWIYFVPGTAEDNGTWYHSSTSTGGTAGTRNGRVISIGTSATFDETNAFVDGLVPYGDIP